MTGMNPPYAGPGQPEEPHSSLEHELNNMHSLSFFEFERRRGTAMIEPGATGLITVDRYEERRIATYGLAGTTAAAVVAERRDGRRQGYIQHFGASSNFLSANMLAQAIDMMKSEAVHARAVIMTPGVWTSTSESTGSIELLNAESARFLGSTAAYHMGEDPDVQIIPYQYNRPENSYSQGTLLIEFPAAGGMNIFAEMALIPAARG